MAVGNKGQNTRRPNKEQYTRKTNEIRSNARPRADHKPGNRSERAFVERHLKNCPARGKNVRNVTNPTISQPFPAGHNK